MDLIRRILLSPFPFNIQHNYFILLRTSSDPLTPNNHFEQWLAASPAICNVDWKFGSPQYAKHGNTNRAWEERTWETRWEITLCRLREFIDTPSNTHVEHNLTRHSLVRLNRIRTGYGRFKYNMNQMELSPSSSASCECALQASQTAHHMAREYPLHCCDGDLVVLDIAAYNWLRDLHCDI